MYPVQNRPHQSVIQSNVYKIMSDIYNNSSTDMIISSF